MRARFIAVVAASAVLALTGCSDPEVVDDPATTPTSVTEGTPELTSEEPSETLEQTTGGNYLEVPDPAAHLACVGWTELGAEDGLTGENATSVASRALDSKDPEMTATVSLAGIGPLITDPWSLSSICEEHGYEALPGSLAEHFSV